jgi:hypothetical protein
MDSFLLKKKPFRLWKSDLVLPRQAWDKLKKGRALKKDRSFSLDEQPFELSEGGHVVRRKRHFLSHLYIKAIILPRQARDKHRESTPKREWRFSSAGERLQGG